MLDYITLYYYTHIAIPLLYTSASPEFRVVKPWVYAAVVFSRKSRGKYGPKAAALSIRINVLGFPGSAMFSRDAFSDQSAIIFHAPAVAPPPRLSPPTPPIFSYVHIYTYIHVCSLSRTDFFSRVLCNIHNTRTTVSRKYSYIAHQNCQ